MKSVAAEAERGKLVLGVCNGFQILCEAGLLPGALIRNRSLNFVCEHVHSRVENMETAFSHAEVTLSNGKLLTARTGVLLRMPIAHGEGSYTADPETLRELNRKGQIVLRYADARGAISDEANPNGSAENIAGIVNEAGNVFGLMPHPERACDALLGSEDGKLIFQSVIESAGRKTGARAGVGNRTGL
jgi:phosphoribosylformylglycinamidine synthase